MQGTPTSDRTPPARRFENYILTRVVDRSLGLTNTPNSAFIQVSGSTGAGSTDDDVGPVQLIGFDFSFDGVTYKSWAASTNGWMVLCDANSGSFTTTEVLSSSNNDNTLINSAFSSNAVLLAPWFDDLKNVLSSPDQLSAAPFSYSTTKISRINNGLEPVPIFVRSDAYGVSYCHDARSREGRRLIVRWTSITPHDAPSSVIEFETVVYENGTIEFRYAPGTSINTPLSASEGATVGIFMPNGTNRFRDFSSGLGYRDDQRTPDDHGGYTYNASYTDSSVPYTVNLLPHKHWPASRTEGCVLRFSPPTNRRKVLPRKLTNVIDSRQQVPSSARTGDVRKTRNNQTRFDDRKSPVFSETATTIVNMPTTLTRFFGGTGLGVAERQDLFSGDFTVTGSTSKLAIEQFINEDVDSYVEPFNETRLHGIESVALTSSFFSTGSTTEQISSGFSQPMWSKTQVRLSLPVSTRVTMVPSASSIYYYNSTRRAWEVPTNSSYIIANGGSSPPSPNPYSGGDLRNAAADASNSRIIEDARGFGPVGNIVSSGSRTPGTAEQTDSVIGSTYNRINLADIVGKQYDKSIRNNEEYKATSDETFQLPIEGPFLIEKAIFDLPLRAGSGWFSDQTQCFEPLVGTGSFDFAGPALTIALHRQVNLSENGSRTVRDLILTGTITHTNDNTSSIVLTTFSPYGTADKFQLRPVGFLAYANPPGAVVNPGAANTFTGSVKVEAAALSAVGASVIYKRTFNDAAAAVNKSNVTTFMTRTPTIVLEDDAAAPAQTVRVGYVSPLGRGGTGFDQAGRCILGNEFVTLQGCNDPSGRTVPNPFAVTSLTTQQSGALEYASFTANALAVVPVVTHFASPYLVMPGDRLVLSISKMRPFTFGDGSSVPQFSGSTVMHDVSLDVGSIGITLYGSVVRAGAEISAAPAISVGTNVVHELIGADPIVDQFDVFYRGELSGSTYDNFVLGSTTNIELRSLKLSKLNARNVASLPTGSVDIAINPYKGFRAQSWHEKVSDVRLLQCTDSTERFWDSMMPGIADCFRADGTGIFIAPPGTFGDFRQVDIEVTSSVATYNPKRSRPGWIFMDNLHPGIEPSFNVITNASWNKAFPFEPRYSGVSRQLDISKSLIASYIYRPSYNVFQEPSVDPIVPTPVNGLIFGTIALSTSVSNYLTGTTVTYTSNTQMYQWFVDVNLSGKVANPLVTPTMPSTVYVTASMSIEDTSRVLFGFGDRNTSYEVENSGVRTRIGTNHFPESRDVEGPHPDGVWTYYDANDFRFSPVIRGWKYGVYSGLPTYSKAYFRRGRYGQFRDMLEQRLYTKYFQYPSDGVVANLENFHQGVQPAAVEATFVDAAGRLTNPENTWTQNQSFEVTSSLPYFDGVMTSRRPINLNTLNAKIITLNANQFGQVTI